MRRILRDEGGQSVVLIAVSLPVVLSLMLLVIDGGRLYVDRERIRNAAQLAAEAAVSLAADAPGGSQPSARAVRDIVKESLDRNLPGESFTHSVTAPFRSELSTYNVKVSVTKPFRASVQAVTFNIGADGAAKLGEGSTGTLPPPPTPTPVPTPTARPTPSPTPSPTASPAPSARPTATPTLVATPTPRPPVPVWVCADAFDGTQYPGGRPGQTIVGVNVFVPPQSKATMSYLYLGDWVALSDVGTWGNSQYMRHLNGWRWYFGWGGKVGQLTPYAYLHGYPQTTLPPLTLAKTQRSDYRCTSGTAQ